MDRSPGLGATPDPAYGEENVLDQARSGDTAAMERLYSEHRDSARRLAVLLVGADGAEDLVAESFARVLSQLREGRGPTTNFRGYLHATIRNRHRDNLRAARERPSSDLPWILDGEELPTEELVEGIDSNGAMAALQSLPSSWQRILWYLDVEGYRPAEVAETLGMTPVAVSSLAYRARDGLRRAYLEHATLGEQPRKECRWTRERLSQYVRGDLSPRASAKVLHHVEGCAACAGVVARMDELNKRLALLTFPIVLVGGMLALELPIGGSEGGALAETLRERSEGTGGAGATGAGAPSSAATGIGSLVAGANVPAFVAAVVAGVLAVGGTVWAVSANDGTTPDAQPRATTESTAPAVVSPESTVIPPAPSATPTPPAPLVRTAVEDEVVPVEPTDPPLQVVVRARAPSARAITACGTFGSLRMPVTPGVRYQRTRGDGRQGPWRVRAVAEPGYVLADGSPAQFSGHLGTYFACAPTIQEVSKVSQGDPATDPWDVAVTPSVTGTAPTTLGVVYTFDTGVLITARSGDGWTCKEPGGTEVGAGTEYSFTDPGIAFTCTFAYTGVAPPTVTLSVYGQDPNQQIVNPTGSVSLTAGGVTVDEQAFA